MTLNRWIHRVFSMIALGFLAIAGHPIVAGLLAAGVIACMVLGTRVLKEIHSAVD